MSNDPGKKNLPQITPDKNIALASKQLATVHKNLTTINREKFIKFLEGNKDTAEFFINLISRYSNVLDMDLIEQYGDQLDWRCLSQNESLPWSEDFIERFADRWKLYELSFHEFLPWSEELIERYRSRWEWGEWGKWRKWK